MLNKIIEFSLKNKLIIGLFTLALMVYGLFEVSRLPIDAVPDITNNQVQIITVAPALGATDIERLITTPIEQANSNVPGLEELRSYSSFGLSVITVVFEDGIDIYWARQQITERLNAVQEDLPQGFGSPFLAPVTTGLGEIYQYVVRPEKGYEGKYDAKELRSIQDWVVRKQLLGVKGVADVSSFGGDLKQYEVAVLPEKLLENKITINDIFDALESNNQNTGGSYIEKGPTALFIRSEGLAGNQEDLEKIVVKNLPNGIPLLIKDVAEVRLGEASKYGALTYNGELQVAGAIVLMLKGANSNEVISAVKSRIEEIKHTLPEGITIEPFIDRTKMVDNSISTVSKNLLEGALIVVFVLVIFLGNFRAGLLVASVIPLSMLFAIILMNMFGVSGNLMSLGALDFGLIVDGAVIIVEATMHQLTHSKRFRKVNKLSSTDMDSEVKLSASRMMNSAVFGQIIILIVYLPIFTLVGIEGKMFKPMAQTVAFALLGAFVLSLTYVPMMSSLFLSKKISHKKTLSDKLMDRLERFYQGTLLKVLRRQRFVIGGVLVLFAFAIFQLTRLGGEFIPALPEGDFAVETRVLPGSNLKTSIDAVSKASKILLGNFPEIERIVAKSGTSEVPSEPLPFDVTDMIIVLKKRDQWTSASSYQELEAKMSDAVKEIPGVSFSFQYPVAMRFNELISGARQDVVCKIFGDNLDTLARYADLLGSIARKVDGAEGVYVEAIGGLPQITIQYNRAAIAQYGLSVAAINDVVNTAFAGKKTGVVYEGEKRFDLVVRLVGEKRSGLEDVQNLLIPTEHGSQIPLKLLANVDIIEGPNQIQRENAQRRIIVGFNIRGRDVQSVVKDVEERVNEEVKLPPSYSITYGGAFENLEAAKGRLSIAVPVSLLLIFLLLFFAFRSVKLSLLIYSAIPLSAIGGILALSLRDISFSISAGVGFIALFGVAVLNGIVLIAEFNRLKAEGYKDLQRIVVTGTKIRLRPVLMTAFVASLGFLPMAISTGEGAEVQRPLATVVIGGLLLATLLTLFVLPILYIVFQKPRKMKTIRPIMLLIFALLSTQGTRAQETKPIGLQQAIDSAFANNLSLKNHRLQSEYQQKLIKSSAQIQPTNISGGFGQMNSSFFDKSIGISQSLSFPTVYSRQKKLMNEVWKSSVIQIGVKELELKRDLSELYFSLQYFKQQRNILVMADSIYALQQMKIEQRFKAGEINLLEKATAEQQRMQIGFQLSQLDNDFEIYLLRFNLLLNTANYYVPISEEETLIPLLELDSARLAGHPEMRIWQQEQSIAYASTKVEQSKLLPDLTLSYNIMSMRGMGADNLSYTSKLAFQSGNIGLAMPLFSGAQRSQIQAAKINEAIIDTQLQDKENRLKSEVEIHLLNLQNANEIIAQFEKTGLENANQMLEVADKQFENGDIDFLQWVMIVNQAIAIESNYLQAKKNKNIAIVQLNYYNY